MTELVVNKDFCFFYMYVVDVSTVIDKMTELIMVFNHKTVIFRYFQYFYEIDLEIEVFI